jgi:hypothetical protein
VEPETNPATTLPIGDLTAISVEALGAGVVRLSIAHGHTLVSVLLLPTQVDELAAAMVAASPIPLELAEQVDQVVTEVGSPWVTRAIAAVAAFGLDRDTSLPEVVEPLLMLWRHYHRLSREQVAQVVQHFTAGGAS